MGDLNATAGSPAVSRLVAGGLRDTLAELGERRPQAGTHHPWDGSTDGTRIDYVLVGGQWDVLGARIDHARPGGRLPSDHWPVVADVALRPPRRDLTDARFPARRPATRASPGGTLPDMDAEIRPLVAADRPAVARP